jgi:hypothetical protein
MTTPTPPSCTDRSDTMTTTDPRPAGGTDTEDAADFRQLLDTWDAVHPDPADHPDWRHVLAEIAHPRQTAALYALAARSTTPPAPAELVVYRAELDTIPLGTYRTERAAMQHCEAVIGRTQPDAAACGRWISDDLEDPDAARTLYLPDGDREELDSGCTVVRIPVADAYDPDADE